MAEPHQPPYPLQHPPPSQQHQSMTPWYGMPPHMYQSQQTPALPPQHHAMPWGSTVPTSFPIPPPPADQSYSFVSQPYPVPPPGDFYAPRPHQQQVHHHYPPPPQPAQPQFTYMYGQQDQVWQQANSSWGYQPWPQPAQSSSLSQEEVWAAKARAWAASKAVQDEPRPTAPQSHQDYMFQPQEQHSHVSQQHTLQPPGQETINVPSYQNSAINQGQSAPLGAPSEPSQSLGYSHPTQAMTSSIKPETGLENFEQKVDQTGAQHANDSHTIFRGSQIHDVATSYGVDTAVTGPNSIDRLDPVSESLPKSLSTTSFSQQATHLLPQSQASPLISQPHLPYSDKLSAAAYEPQQQMSSAYIQPSVAVPPQQPLTSGPPQVHHQVQKLPLPAHHQTPASLEIEGEFGLSPGSLQNWAPVAGMPFPPAMGAGTSQFDPLHTPHQAPVPWRPDGQGLQGLGFPSSAPFVVGTGPGVVPGTGPPVRPLYAPDGFIERPKKAAVPSWLREELLKKKAAGLSGNASGMISSDESNRVNGGEPANPSLGQRAGVSDKLRSSSPGMSEDEEEDQEEEIEAARTAAINQEIKRLLTEVLLKVTGDLFKEIAQEVLDEDTDDVLQGMPDERSRANRLASPSSPHVAPSSGRVLVATGKHLGTDDSSKDKGSSDSGEAAGDVLGLGSYASDDETEGAKVQMEAVHHSSFETDKQNMDGMSTADYEHEESANFDRTKLAEASAQCKELNQKVNDIKEQDHPCASDVGQQTGAEGGDDKAQSALIYVNRNEDGTHSNSATAKLPNSLLDKQSRPIHGAADQNSIDLSKKFETKEIAVDIPIKDRKKEDRVEQSVKDVSMKERKREDKPIVDSKSREKDDKLKSKSDASSRERNFDDRMKDSKEVKRARGSESRVRDSSRERRKEKERTKDKLKPREREYDRERKKHDKWEREGRSKRRDDTDKKARHHSTSSSMSPDRDANSSSSSDRSRGKSRARRSSRHHTTAAPSPSRSRKRCVLKFLVFLFSMSSAL
ncbi:hypothetical protein KP509_04G048500 [Ceratopteris richardii]|uniref:Uncharacterized protein n=1 Tax=Ceratopteris richardii TaxID=49495 RepID=A0A8T2V060_CERRI|nr:hypothetical protein KP509_04G048500 [Ceratopteris richardii]KAH7439175.1 hypothetical protein KP509_04G048500 [Ceratopteris richardii]KAH7439180.1 hypothetical protein KP509_04G048500 [Ceratopteris richardii]